VLNLVFSRASRGRSLDYCGHRSAIVVGTFRGSDLGFAAIMCLTSHFYLFAMGLFKITQLLFKVFGDHLLSKNRASFVCHF
jgi:hypothetical protein